MKMRTRGALVLLVVLGVSCATVQVAQSHCEIPCGIYGDKTRIDLLYEDIATVEKSMTQIQKLTGSGALDVNQRTRWIQNKEDHAGKIQHTVTQYFMTQRVKPKAAGTEGHEKYIKQITTLHSMLISAMKCKQTVDTSHCAQLRKLVDGFSAAYFSAEDLEHIRKGHGKGG